MITLWPIHTCRKCVSSPWIRRLSVSVGGKISTGSDVSGQNNTFFDNVELQYRTSDISNQYLQLFYKRAVYDFLEGYVGQYGAGYMWKRKLQNFRDIFQFGDKNLELRRRMMNNGTTNPSSMMGPGAGRRQGEVNGVRFGVDSVKVDSVAPKSPKGESSKIVEFK